MRIDTGSRRRTRHAWALGCAALLLALGCAAQTQTAKDTPVPLAGAAFALQLDAPAALQPLLSRHLELLRYRDVPDLDDTELTRLVASAEADARQLLATQGYFSPQLRLDWQPGTPRQVRLHLDPGPLTRVGPVELTLDAPLPPAEREALRKHLLGLWPLPAGHPFTQADWDSAKQQVLRELGRQRYPAAHWTLTQAEIDPAQHQAHLTLALASGPLYRLGPLQISGLQRQDAALVERLVRLGPGSEYDTARLQEAQQRLIDSGFFDAVFVQVPTDGPPEAAPVHIDLREAPLQKLVLGVGASTDSGARLSLEHTHRRVPWLQWQAVTQLAIDRNTRQAGLSLLAPPDDSLWRWSTSALVKNEQASGDHTHSEQLRAGRSQGGERIDRSLYLQYDRTRDTSTGQAEALTLNTAWTRRSFDSLPFPSQGRGLALELGAGLTLGQPDQPFVRALGRWREIWPLGEHSRLSVRTELGAVLAPPGADIPTTQRFLTGGDNAVRGYAYHSLGVTQSDGQIGAGRYLATGSLEWQHALARQGRWADWEGAVFVDGGAVANQFSALQAHTGVGSGLRWKSPIGPLQIDLAYAVQLHQWRLHLNLGFSL